MLKFSSDFIYKRLKDSGAIVPVGERARSFPGMVTVNETGCTLIERLREGCEREDLVAALLNEYEVTREVAEADTDAFLSKMRDASLLEE